MPHRRQTRPLLLHFSYQDGSIFDNVKWPVAAFSVYAFVLYAIHKRYCWEFGTVSSSLSSILSMVVGMMLSFRASSSSDRWHEGRRLWSGLTSNSRSFLRTLSLVDGNKGEEAMRLVVALPYALKEHLRDKDPMASPHLLTFLPKNFIEQNQKRMGKISHLEESEATRSMHILNDDSPDYLDQLRKPNSGAESSHNVPLQILRQLQAKLDEMRASTNDIDGAVWGNCTQLIKETTDTISQCERIRDTPIPSALGIHLQQMLFLFLAATPPQLVRTMGIWVVPATAIASFSFLGIDRAAEQLSDPFGTQPNDLPTSRFAAEIEREFWEYSNSESPKSFAIPSLPATNPIHEKKEL